MKGEGEGVSVGVHNGTNRASANQKAGAGARIVRLTQCGVLTDDVFDLKAQSMTFTLSPIPRRVRFSGMSQYSNPTSTVARVVILTSASINALLMPSSSAVWSN